MKLKEFDIVGIITSPRQENEDIATILEVTEFEGEEAAVIQYHYKSCREQTILTKYMRKLSI